MRLLGSFVWWLTGVLVLMIHARIVKYDVNDPNDKGSLIFFSIFGPLIWPVLLVYTLLRWYLEPLPKVDDDV